MTVRRARNLRRDQTEVEKILWRELRDRRLGGLKFRRQVPIGPFVVDFFCPKENLIIETDGGQHSGSERDRKRERWLEANGYSILRFWNNEVLENIEGVKLKVLERLNHPLT